MKICVRCGSQNSSNYKYCKFCGAELPCVDQKAERQYKNEYCDDNIDFSPDSENIAIYEVDRFIGKNYEQITPKFITLQQTDKKFMWCLPAFLFGLFLGLPGVAVWFLYRKMTRPAVLMLSAALVMECVNMYLSFDAISEFYKILIDGFAQYAGMAEQNPTMATEWFLNYLNQMTAWADSTISNATYWAFDFFNTYICQLAAPIIISLLGWFFYKKHSLKKISDIKRTSETKGQYAIRLTREGGTSVGRVALGLVIYISISFAISLVPLIATLFSL